MPLMLTFVFMIAMANLIGLVPFVFLLPVI